MEDNQREEVGGGNADWMSHLPEELLDVPLWNLAIPGNVRTAQKRPVRFLTLSLTADM